MLPTLDAMEPSAYLPGGATVRVLREEGSWLNVQLPNGDEGYVRARDVLR